MQIDDGRTEFRTLLPEMAGSECRAIRHKNASIQESSSIVRRFVILIHDHPFLHWDLLLENEASLRSWRLLTDPEGLMRGERIPAEAIPDHRKVYLDYQGPISGDRGSVSQWDAGTFELTAETPTASGLEFAGRCIQGHFKMMCEAGQWSLQRDDRS